MTDDNFPNVCRLCLQVDDFIVDIFHNLDPNPDKRPLPERIYDLFQVKVAKSDGLPTSICHTCLYYTETFSEFKSNVRKCEARLQNYVASLGILGSIQSPVNDDGIKQEIEDEAIEDYTRTVPNDNSLVTVVDPNQDYESSDDSFSIDSENEFPEQDPKKGVEKILQSEGVEIINEPDEKSGPTFNDIAADGVDRNVYLCQYCDMAFTAQFDCSVHEGGHDQANPYSCTYCVYKCSSRQVLIAHIKDVHDNDRPYVCIQCHKGFGRRSDLKKHTIVHTGVRPFTCPVCNKNFSRNTNLTKHLRIHTGLKPHVCQKCPRSFTTTADLVRHQRVHVDSKPFQCPKCPSSFTRKDKLMHHERAHIRKEKQNTPVPAMPNGETANPVRQINGTGQDMENMVISLDPYTDMNQGENSAHNNSVDSLQNTPKKPIATLPAPGQEGRPQEHVTGDVVLNINSGDDYNNVYSCDYCPQKFTLFSALIHHNSTHNNFKGHVCTVCSKRFMRKRELQRHSVIHTGLKPYSCRFCNKRFNRKDKVVRHERIHTEEKFNCTQCELGFSKQEALDMHLKVHELNNEASQQQQMHHHQQYQQHFPQHGQFPPFPFQQQGQQSHQSYYHHGQPQFPPHNLPENILRDHPSNGGPPGGLLPLLPSVYMPGFMPPQMNFYNELRSDD